MSLKDRTKILFADTLMKMMKTKELKDIRVGELCEQCGAHRRTFYYHFKDKYDLMAWILDHGYDDTSQPENIMTEHTTLYVLNKIRNNQAFYKRFYSDPGISDMMGYLVNYNCQRYETALKDSLHLDELTNEQIFSIRMYVYGGVYITREWVLGGCKMEPEEFLRRNQTNLPNWMKS